MPQYRIYGEIYEAASPEEAWKKHAAKASPGMFGGLAQQFNQGASMGGADELMAGAEKLVGRDYGASMERQRREREAFASQHPYLSAGATALGAVAPVVAATVGGAVAGGPVGAVGGGAATGSRALNMTLNALYGGGNAMRNVQTVSQGIREGARYGLPTGTVAGALSAEPGDRTSGAATGGAFGAGVGGAFGGGSQALINAGAKVTPYLQRVVEFMGLAQQPGISRVAPAGPGAVSAPITSAEIKILETLERSGVTPEAAAMQLARSRELGVPLGLVDVGGQGTQRLARGVRSLGGEGSQILDEQFATRASGQPGRVVNYLERALGRKASGNAEGTSDSLLTRARGQSSPLYKQLDTLPPIDNPDVTNVFGLPFVRDIVQRAQRVNENMGGSMAPLYDEAGQLVRQPTFRDVDFVKQQIDEILSPTYQQGMRPADAVSASTRMERDLAKGVRDRLVGAADSSPGGDIYAGARASYGGPARARDMYNQGLDFRRKDTSLEDVRAMIGRSSPFERKWYERGVVEALRGGIGGMDDLTSSPNVLRSFYGNSDARAKLSTAVNPRRLDNLESRLDLENEAARTSNFVRGGSPTVDKAVDAADAAASVATTATGSPKAALTEAAARAYDTLRARANEQTRAEIARRLTSFDDPLAQQRFLERLIKLQQRGNLRAQDVAATARAMTAQNELDER